MFASRIWNEIQVLILYSIKRRTASEIIIVVYQILHLTTYDSIVVVLFRTLMLP